MPKTKKIRKTPRESTRGLIVVAISCVIAIALFILVSNLIKDKPKACANSISCMKDLSGEFEEDSKAVFMGREVSAPSRTAFDIPVTQVLGVSNENKRIYVDLATQRIAAYEGENKVYDFPVSTGKWSPTPTGDFKIWVKLVRTKMSGGSGADYYYLPNVPYTMFFYNESVPKSMGFGIHGAYWHNNFGYPMSHGCINMRPEDAKLIFAWAGPVSDESIAHATSDNPGTMLTISGEIPSE